MDYAYNYNSMDIGEAGLSGLAAFGGMMLFIWILGILLMVIRMAAMWKIFVKADRPGWGAVVPIYHLYLMFDLTLGNGWLFLTMFLPFINIYFGIKCYVALAKKFGYPWMFALGLFFLEPVFLCILGFGNCVYDGVQRMVFAEQPLSEEERELQRQEALAKLRRQHNN